MSFGTENNLKKDEPVSWGWESTVNISIITVDKIDS